MSDALLHAAFYAAAGFMLLFGLLQSLLLRDRLHLLYTAAVGAAVLWMLGLDGTAGWLPWSAAATPLPGAATAVAGIVFTREFLETRAACPGLDRFLRAMTMILPLWAASAFFVPLLAAEPVSHAIAITTTGVCLAAGITALFRGRTIARFYIPGLAAVFAAAVYGAAAIRYPDGIHPATMPGILEAAIVFNALMFAAAMADRARSVRLERDAATARAFRAIERRREVRQRLHDARTAGMEAELVAEQTAHRLRTATDDLERPLAAMRAALTGMLEQQRLPAGAAERLGASLDYLDDLASRCLAETTGDSGLPGRASPATGDGVPAATILDAVDTLFRASAERKGLAFRCRRCSFPVRGNPTELTRILGNVVANAINYAERGGILIGCRRRGGALRLLVYDTGPGLDAAELTRVMQRGERGAAASGVPGCGLGLAIVSELAAASGIEIEARSTPGRGSCFGIVVPIAHAG